MSKRSLSLLPLIALVALIGSLLAVAPVRAAGGTVTPSSGGLGTRFHFTASGFTAREWVHFWATGPDGRSYPRYPSLKAEMDGSVVWSWDVEAGMRNGQWTMTAMGTDSDVRVEIPFTLVDVPPVVLPATVTPSSGPRGTTFSFTMGGMVPGERLGAWLTQPDGRSRDFVPGEEFRAYADRNGATSWLWVAPSDAQLGQWQATLRGLDSGREVSVGFVITGEPQAGPSRYVEPEAGPPGTTFTVVVGGLNPEEEAGSWLTRPDGSSVAATPYLRANLQGVVTWTWTAPGDAPGGMWQAVTKGQDSQIQVALPFTVGGSNPTPPDPNVVQVRLSSSSVQPGATITVEASGFAADEDLSYWATRPDGLPVHSQEKITANGQGAASWKYQVPQNAVAGQWTMTVRGDDSRRSAQATFMVQAADPGSSVTPSSGPPGTTFTFTAGGFLDDYEKVFFWFVDPNGRSVDGPEEKNSDNNNRVTWTWTAPKDALGGQWQAVALGESSRVQRIIPFTINNDQNPSGPGAAVNPERGAPGTTFTFTASGYEKDERVGYWLNQPDGTIIRFDRELIANRDGVVTWTWTAPATAQRGLYTMAARSSQNDKVNNDVSYTIRFTVE
nr:hypothetical protein [Oscillochloris trichoides]